MKTKFLIFAALVPLVGCNLVKRIPGHGEDTPPAAAAPGLPDDYTVTGTTVNDADKIIMKTQGRSISVEVKRPGESEFSLLKGKESDREYREYAVFTIPRDGVRFTTRLIYFAGGGFIMGSEPSAPTGTQYRIRSVAESTDHNLY